MKKNKQKQLTGGVRTPGENVPQQALLLCCWGLHAAAGGETGNGNAKVGDEDGAVMQGGPGLEVGPDVAHDRLQFGI